MNIARLAEFMRTFRRSVIPTLVGSHEHLNSTWERTRTFQLGVVRVHMHGRSRFLSFSSLHCLHTSFLHLSAVSTHAHALHTQFSVQFSPTHRNSQKGRFAPYTNLATLYCLYTDASDVYYPPHVLFAANFPHMSQTLCVFYMHVVLQRAFAVFKPISLDGSRPNDG